MKRVNPIAGRAAASMRHDVAIAHARISLGPHAGVCGKLKPVDAYASLPAGLEVTERTYPGQCWRARDATTGDEPARAISRNLAQSPTATSPTLAPAPARRPHGFSSHPPRVRAGNHLLSYCATLAPSQTVAIAPAGERPIFCAGPARGATRS